MTSTYFPLGPPDVKFHEDNPRKVTVMAPFEYRDPEKDILVRVPAGFVSDGNSVPKAAWSYFAPWECPEAGVVHDWLYDAPGAFTRLSTGEPPSAPLDKASCDDLHRRIMDLKGFRWSKRQLIWGILRTCGFLAWNAHRKLDPKP